MSLRRMLQSDPLTAAFPFLLILAGAALILFGNLGVLSAEHVAQFWPLAIVAAGLAELDPQRTNGQ